MKYDVHFINNDDQILRNDDVQNQYMSGFFSLFLMEKNGKNNKTKWYKKIIVLILLIYIFFFKIRFNV